MDHPGRRATLTEDLVNGRIDGCHVIRSSANSDDRGHLSFQVWDGPGPVNVRSSDHL